MKATEEQIEAAAKAIYDEFPEDPFEKPMTSDGFELPYSYGWEYARQNVPTHTGVKKAYRMARAALEAVPEVEPLALPGYESGDDAVYILIRTTRESPLWFDCLDTEDAEEAIYLDHMKERFDGEADVLAVEISDNPTDDIRNAVATAKASTS